VEGEGGQVKPDLLTGGVFGTQMSLRLTMEKVVVEER